MKFCRFVPQERPDSAPAPLYGILDEYQLREISGAPWVGVVTVAAAWRSHPYAFPP